MSYFNIVAQTTENTVVTEYEPVTKRSDAYQSETELEREYIRMLTEQGYEYLSIHTEAELLKNLRAQMERLNNYHFSDAEWNRFFSESIANPNEHIVEKTRKIQEDFVQVLKRDDGTMLWFEMRCQHQRLSMDESRYICLIKNISNTVENQHRLDEAETKLKSLLRNTGDFLWKFDFESRQLFLLTPMMDDDYRDVPRSGGVVDIESLMPEDDFKLLERVMNECMMKAGGEAAYDDKGHLLDEQSQLNRLANENARFGTLKIRCWNSEKNLVWYDFRGHLAPDDEDRIVMMGSARRVETSPEIPFLMKSGVEESLINSLFNFPNIGIFWVDRNFTILGCNNAFATDSGFAKTDEVVNQSLKDVISVKYLPYYDSMIKDVFDNGSAKSWKGKFDDSDLICTINVVPMLKSLLKSGYTVSRVLCVYMRISG